MTNHETPKLTRSEQSRINGAHSNGPTSIDGKAISSKNALKHGFAASANVVLGVEDKYRLGAVAKLETAGSIVENLTSRRRRRRGTGGNGLIQGLDRPQMAQRQTGGRCWGCGVVTVWEA